MLGIALLLVGLIWQFAPGVTKAFTWFGRLPGDIRMQNGSSEVFIPLTSMILVSIVGSVLLNLFARFFK